MLTPKEIASVALANAARRPVLSANAERERLLASPVALGEEGERYWRLELDVPEAFHERYTQPAQYITLTLDELEPRYLALASSPHEPHWQFLIGKDSTIGRSLATSPELSQSFCVSAPEGSGFSLDVQDSSAPIILFTTGSGIATMRGVLAWLEKNHPVKLAHTHLYYGELHEHTVAYQDELTRWRAAGVQITFAFDAPKQPDYPWRFVQQPFTEAPPEGSIAQGTFLMSGSAVMLRFASEALLKMGVHPDRLLLNV